MERPNQAFWERFDGQLRQKFLEQGVKVSLWTKCRTMMQKWDRWIRSFAYTTATCCLLVFGVMQFSSSKIEVRQIPRVSSPIADIIPFPKTWTDVTLAFDSSTQQHIQYICDNIHISQLNSTMKELVF
ncbi:MAG: hypothetical protein LBR92_01515 [Puniceicoccales bacterium]|nr:hypothetical protein [Puniceicoccales bacterium]